MWKWPVVLVIVLMLNHFGVTLGVLVALGIAAVIGVKVLQART